MDYCVDIDVKFLDNVNIMVRLCEVLDAGLHQEGVKTSRKFKYLFRKAFKNFGLEFVEIPLEEIRCRPNYKYKYKIKSNISIPQTGKLKISSNGRQFKLEFI